MENKKQFISKVVKQLLTNEVFRFWKKDWSDNIVIDWPKKVHKDKFFSKVRDLLGPGFNFERAISYDKIDFIANNNGLTPL